MVTEQVQISVVSALSGIAVAYITNVLAKRYSKDRESKPKDRMERMFDGYERLIRQKDLEDERKVILIKELKEELSITKQIVYKLEKTLADTQAQLSASQKESAEFKTLLRSMREEYKETKRVDIQK